MFNRITAIAIFALVFPAVSAGEAAEASGLPDTDAESAAPSEPGDRIIGLWATDKAEAHVEIFATDSGYAGRIVWLKEPFYPDDDEMAGEAKVDRENPDAAARSNPIIGLTIVSGFRYAGKDKWVDGSIYDPENGKTYHCKMWLTDDGLLKLRGYVGISLFGRTTEWTPVLGVSGTTE